MGVRACMYRIKGVVEQSCRAGYCVQQDQSCWCLQNLTLAKVPLRSNVDVIHSVAAGAGARSWTPRPNVRVCSPMSFADFARARTPVFRWLYVA